MVVAVAVLAVAGLAVFEVTSSGARGAQRAGEWELSTILGGRVMDRLVSGGYTRLSAQVGKAGRLDLAALGEPAAATPTTSGQLVLDGIVYEADYAVQERLPGLLALELTLTWRSPLMAVSAPKGGLHLRRYVANPSVAMDSREPLR